MLFPRQGSCKSDDRNPPHLWSFTEREREREGVFQRSWQTEWFAVEEIKKQTLICFAMWWRRSGMFSATPPSPLPFMQVAWLGFFLGPVAFIWVRFAWTTKTMGIFLGRRHQFFLVQPCRKCWLVTVVDQSFHNVQLHIFKKDTCSGFVVSFSEFLWHVPFI